MRQFYKSQNRLTTRINSVVILILATILMVGLISPASAKGKKVNSGTGTYLLAVCRSSVDTKKHPRDQNIIMEDGFNSCCSKEAGFCIQCPVSENYCTKYPYRKVTDRWNKGLISPPSDQVTAPVDDSPKRPWATGIFRMAPTTSSTD